MSKIEQLSIQGIRSFSSHGKGMAIKFDTPITLIVGTNGSGKTTIIECLKYATCGELPPNSSNGKMFVHDPQMAGENEVLAQIKMSFLATDGVRMVIARNLQLSAKMKTRTFKTLEGSIKMLKGGERNVVSSKVTEMNTLVPRYLGVSRAVLENVIFCHQEDSFWPMESPVKLKEKFDQIFEAQKYTKAIDNIKILEKKTRGELELHKNDELHMKEKHETSKKQRYLRVRLVEEAERLQREKESHARDLQEAHEKTQEFWKKMGEAELIVGELKGKRIARDTKLDSVRGLRKNLTEMADTDEELQHMLAQYEERLHQYEADLTKQTRDYGTLSDGIAKTREDLLSKEREQAGYEKEKEAHERQVQSRKQLVRETARSHDIRGYDLEIDDSKVAEFRNRLTRKGRDHDAEWERARAESRGSLELLRKELTGLNERRSARKQTKESSRQSIANYDRKVEELQVKQNKIVYDEGSTASIHAQFRDLQGQLESAQEEQSTSRHDADIAKADAELRSLKKQREDFEEEMLEASRRSGDTANLDFLRKELNSAQRSLTTMLDAHKDRITALVGNDWTPVSLEDDYRRVVQNTASQLTEAENQRDGSVRDMEYAQAKINQVQQELKMSQAEIKKHKARIRDAVGCEPQDYQFEMDQLEQTRGNLGGDQKLYEFLTWSMKMAKQHDYCALCKRSFKHKTESDPIERNNMLASAEALLKKYVPDSNEEAESILKETEDALQLGKDVSSDFESWERLTNKVVPEKERSLKELEEQHKRLVTASEEKDGIVHEKKTNKAEIDGLSRTVQSIAKSHAEISNYEAQIDDLASKQSNSVVLRGMEIIQTDKMKVDDEAERINKAKTASVSARSDLISKISNLELQCSQAEKKIATAEYQLKEMKSLQSQQEEYRSLISTAREMIKTADAEVQEIETQLATVQAKYDEATRIGNERDRTFQDTANKLTSSINRLEMADKEIQSYHDRGGDDRTSRCRREIDQVKDELTRFDGELRNVTRAINQLKEHVQKHDDIKRSIEDNQRYREESRAYDALVKDIERLEKEDAEEDKRKYEKQCARWQDRRNTAATNEANVSGKLSSVDAQIAQANKDWETDYRHAGRNYKQAHIKVETTKAAIKDLDTYWRALDKAIMKYHSMKMEEINRIVAELWRNTYQGTDVDTILIRSESETVKANKSYNYRVCMIKSEVEMDMRGRCSAGQKMLASIIIRLALAECFGSNCGVIALDEPTTNLDIDNIKALGASLERIIKFRRAQKNFQIIIITHDEDFLRQMNASEFTDKYYRVSRDLDQKSVIDRLGIADIM